MPELSEPTAENVERATKFYGAMITDVGAQLGDDDAKIDKCIIEALARLLDLAEQRGAEKKVR